MMKFATCVALVAAIMSADATGARAQVPGSEPIVGITTTTTATDTAKVTALDLATRTMTLTFPDGTTSTGKAGNAVQNLPQVKVDDTVVAADCTKSEVEPNSNAAFTTSLSSSADEAAPCHTKVRIVAVVALATGCPRAASS